MKIKKKILISVIVFALIIFNLFLSSSDEKICTETNVARECVTGNNKSLEVFAPRFLNGSTYVPIDRTIKSTSGNYNFEVTQGDYQVFFKSDPTSGLPIRISRNNILFEFKPMALNYRNDLNQLEQINQIIDVVGNATANNFVYPNAYGSGINIFFFIFILKGWFLII